MSAPGAPRPLGPGRWGTFDILFTEQVGVPGALSGCGRAVAQPRAGWRPCGLLECRFIRGVIMRFRCGSCGASEWRGLYPEEAVGTRAVIFHGIVLGVCGCATGLI